jgi:hypothetical protein
LKRQFNISNTRAVETICQIAHGETKKLYYMSGKSNMVFQLSQPAVLESLIYLSHTGFIVNKLSGKRLSDNRIIHALEDKVGVLYRQIKKAFGIQKLSKIVLEEIKGCLKRDRNLKIYKEKLTSLRSQVEKNRNFKS